MLWTHGCYDQPEVMQPMCSMLLCTFWHCTFAHFTALPLTWLFVQKKANTVLRPNISWLYYLYDYWRYYSFIKCSLKYVHCGSSRLHKHGSFRLQVARMCKSRRWLWYICYLFLLWGAHTHWHWEGDVQDLELVDVDWRGSLRPLKTVFWNSAVRSCAMWKLLTLERLQIILFNMMQLWDNACEPSMWCSLWWIVT